MPQDSQLLAHAIYVCFGHEFVLNVCRFIRHDQVHYLIQWNQSLTSLHRNESGQWEVDSDGATFRAAQLGEWLETEILKTDISG